jgi:beta-lactamase class D
MRYSVVWYYQAMARDIGKERMQEWVNRADYGSKEENDEYAIYRKTGGSDKPSVGWYVGFIKMEDHTCPF